MSLESVDKLREFARGVINRDAKQELRSIANAIEREVDERYVERPKDMNGDVITFDATIQQWGELDAIFYKYEHSEGEGVWYVRGHDEYAPILRADEVTIAKKPTVEDLLWELLANIRPDMEDEDAAPIVESFAAKMQLRGEDE